MARGAVGAEAAVTPVIHAIVQEMEPGYPRLAMAALATAAADLTRTCTSPAQLKAQETARDWLASQQARDLAAGLGVDLVWLLPLLTERIDGARRGVAPKARHTTDSEIPIWRTGESRASRKRRRAEGQAPREAA